MGRHYVLKKVVLYNSSTQGSDTGAGVANAGPGVSRTQQADSNSSSMIENRLDTSTPGSGV